MEKNEFMSNWDGRELTLVLGGYLPSYPDGSTTEDIWGSLNIGCIWIERPSKGDLI